VGFAQLFHVHQINFLLFQEPGANASEIYATLKYIRPGDGFVPNFPMFAKTDVNGKTENPIYTFLKVRLYRVQWLVYQCRVRRCHLSLNKRCHLLPPFLSNEPGTIVVKTSPPPHLMYLIFKPDSTIPVVL
jgi:hypothetical protein